MAPTGCCGDSIRNEIEAGSARRDSFWSAANSNLRMGGPGFSLFDPNDNYVRVYNSRKDFGPEEWRRMIYETKARMQLDNTFGAFDCPDGGQIAPRRKQFHDPTSRRSIFLNSPFAMQQAGFLAERLRTGRGRGR